MHDACTMHCNSGNQYHSLSRGKISTWYLSTCKAACEQSCLSIVEFMRNEDDSYQSSAFVSAI